MSAIQRAVALGFFDGVHIGHAALMRRLLDISSSTGLAPAVVTFDTLPQNVIENKAILLINSREDSTGIIKRYFGIDDIIVLPFDKKTAGISGSDFIDKLVIKHNTRHFVAGRDFRYGKDAEGNSFTLKKKCSASGLGCDIIPAVSRGSVTCSSTIIRELLLTGDIERANMFLGHPHILTDVVGRGKRLGSKIDAPTINMSFAPGVLVPARGVYATKVYISGNPAALTGVTNIGVRPTVATAGKITAETHIPDCNGDFYGSTVRIEFFKHLRPEMKFENIEELKKQIKKDCNSALDYFNNQENDYN